MGTQSSVSVSPRATDLIRQVNAESVAQAVSAPPRTTNPSKIPDRWLQARSLHYERRGFGPRTAIVLSIGDWREQERLENEFNSQHAVSPVEA